MNMFGILRMTLGQQNDCLLVFFGGTNTAEKCFLLKILLVNGERFEQSYYSSASSYMCKFSNRNTRTRCEICSKQTIKTPERR